MATHSSVLAWRIPGTGEPGGLLSTGSHRVGHDWSDLALTYSQKNIFKINNKDTWIGNTFAHLHNIVKQNTFLSITEKHPVMCPLFKEAKLSTEASLLLQTIKYLPATWETQVWSQSQEDPLQRGMAAHSSILAWRIPWTEEPGGLQFWGSQRVQHH